MELSWSKSRAVPLVHKAVKFLLGVTWNPERYAPFVVLQVTAQYTLGQTFVSMVQSTPDGVMVPMPADPETGHVDDPSLYEDQLSDEEKELRAAEAENLRDLGVVREGCPEFVDEYKKKCIGAIVGGLRRALRLATDAGDPDSAPPDILSGGSVPSLSAKSRAYRYLVENGVVMLWNLHLPAVIRREFSSMTNELREAFELSERALLLVDSGDTALYAAIAEALARIYCAKDQHTEAEALCRRAMVRCRPMQAKPLVQLRAEMIANNLATAGALPASGASAGGGKGKGGGKGGKGEPEASSADGPITFTFDPSAEAPLFDEVAARNEAKAAHFEVFMILQQIASMPPAADGAPAPGQTELKNAIDIMAGDQAAASAAYREAALVAAHKVHTFALQKGGGSVGTLEAAIELKKIIVEARSCLGREEDEELLEMRAELWVRLAKEALKQKNARLAQRCCKCAKDVIGREPNQDLMRRVPARVWRWWSVAERLWAKAVAAMISPTEQEKQTQDQLRCASMEHLLEAAQASLKAGELSCQDLVLAAAQEFWNVALPMMSSPAARASLHRFVEGLLGSLVSASELENANGDDANNDGFDDDEQQRADSEDGLLRMQLFVLLFECLADAERWADGLKQVNASFPHVPPPLQRPLWQWKVVFLSKLGRSALDGMAKMKESDPVMQARVWSALGHASTDKRQQLTSHTKALEILEKDSRPERAEFLVEFAEWCLSVSLPRSDVDNALEGALDVLLDLDESHFAAALDAQAMAADNATLAKDGTASRGQSARSDARSSRGGDGRASASAGGARSVRSSGGARSVRSAGSTRSQGGRSSIGGSRGGRRASPVDVMAASLDAGQLDVIVRCLSMMASLAQTSRKRRDRALQAAYYCERCVSLAIRAANVAKAASVLETSDLVDDAACAAFSSALGLDLKEPISTANFCKVVLCVLEAAPGMAPTFPPPPAASDAVVAPFPYTAETLPGAPYFIAPKSFPEWSRWTPAPELISALQRLPSDLTAYAPSSASFVKMPLTIFHLDALVKVLCSEGCQLQALAPTALAELAVRLAVVPQLPPLVTLTAMRSAALRFSLGDTAGGRLTLRNAPAIGLDENEAKLYLDEVDLIEQQKAAVAAKNKASAECSEEEKAKIDSHVVDGGQRKQPWKISKFEVRQVWAALARECVSPSFLLLRPALEYLYHAARHNEAFGDDANVAECEVVRATVFLRQGMALDAAQGILRAQRLWMDSPKCGSGRTARAIDWAESVVVFARLLRGSGDGVEAERALTETAAVLRSRLALAASRNPQESELAGETAVQAVQAFHIVASALADLAADDGSMKLARSSGTTGGTRNEAVHTFTKRSKMVEALYTELVDSLKQVGPSLLLAQALADFAAVRRRLALAEAADKGAASVEADKLLVELSTLASAEACVKVLLRSLVPPFEQLQFPPPAEGVDKTPGVQQTPPSVWPNPVASAMKSVEGLSTPLERVLARIHVASAETRVKLGIINGEHQSRQRAALEYDRNVTDIVERWMDSTAAPAVPANVQLPVRHLETALLHGAGAERLLRAAPPAHARGGVASGEALVLLAMQKGLLDDVWSTTSPSDPPRPPRRAVLGLGTPSMLVGSSSTESLGKDKKGKKGGAPEVESPASGLDAQLPLQFEMNERGDIAWQARSRLEAAAAAAAASQDWDAVGWAAHRLVELHGCLEPAAGAQWLLLHQSCCARKFLLATLASALEPNSRLALQLNQFAAVGARGGVAVGSAAIASEAETVEAEFIIGRPLEHPACERARRALADKQHSTAWPRLDVSRPVPSTLRALPAAVHALCIQISPDKDAIYVALVGRGSLDAVNTDDPDPDATSAAPVVWRQDLSPEDFTRLAVLKRQFAQWKAELSRFLIKYADDLGDDGDFFVGGATVSVLLGDELAAAQRKQRSLPTVQEGEEPSTEAAEAAAAVEAAAASLGAASAAAQQTLERDSLEQTLLTLSREMDALLGPALGDGDDGANPVGPALEALAISTAAGADGLPPGVLLLLDTDLMDLPVEMVASLRQRSLRPVGRDFSAHVLANRFATANPEGKVTVEVENADFSFVVDPRCEDKGSTNKNYPRSSALETLRETLSNGPVEAAKGWKQGVGGDERIISDGEWQGMLRERAAGGFMFYGPGSVLAHLPPKQLAGLNASGCRLVVLADRMDNEISFRRKSKLDNLKSSSDLALEQPLATVALWTLAGAGSVVTNQWASSFHANSRLVKRLFENLYHKDVSITCCLFIFCVT